MTYVNISPKIRKKKRSIRNSSMCGQENLETAYIIIINNRKICKKKKKKKNPKHIEACCKPIAELKLILSQQGNYGRLPVSNQ